MFSLLPTLDLGDLGSTTGAVMSPAMDLLTPLLTIAFIVIGGVLAFIFIFKLIVR